MADNGLGRSKRPVQVGTPVLAGKQMSASLRERLRKSGRCYSSPLSCKQPCLSPSTPRQPTWPGKWKNGLRTPSNPELLGASAESSSVTEESSVSTEHISCSDITRPRPNRKPEMNTDTGQARLEITSDLKEDHSTTSTSTEPGSTIPHKLVDGSTFSSNMETCSEGVLTLDSMLSTDDTLDELKTKRQKLLQRVQGKKECLRKLNMVKMYRAKNNLTELEGLVNKWRQVSQSSLEELLELTNSEPKPTLGQLIQHLGVDAKLVGFNPDDESFSTA